MLVRKMEIDRKKVEIDRKVKDMIIRFESKSKCETIFFVKKMLTYI